jgi:hypothetical protein
MAIPVRSLRLLPQSQDRLNRLTGSRGEIFYDRDANNIRIFDGTSTGGRLVGRTEEQTQDLVATMFAGSSSNVSVAYDDLTGKIVLTANIPVPEEFSGDYNDLINTPTLAAVATSGSYNDLTDTPVVLGFSGDYQDLINQPTLFSGNYDDLINKPTFSGSYDDLTDLPTLFSGSYNDLTDKPTIPSLTGYATESFVGTAISTLVDAAPGALDTLNELAAALNDDANFSSTVTLALQGKAPIDSPAFTGNTLTAGSVSFSNTDIGNTGTDTVNAPYIEASVGVYSPFFANISGDMTIGPSGDSTGVITFQRQAVFQQTSEVLNTKIDATGPVVHDYSTGAIWYHSTPVTNFTANFTNIPTTNNRTISAVLIIDQGVTAYLPTAVQLNGAAQTINWSGATAPTGNASQIDTVSFTFIRISDSWTVIGSLTSYG